MENHLFFMKQLDGENHMLRSEAYSLASRGLTILFFILYML